MKLGVSMWCYVEPWKKGELDIPGFIREVKRIGADGVELLDFFYKDLDADRAAASAALIETGLAVSAFSVSNNFAKEGEWDAQLARITFGVDEALRYGSQIVRVFAGDVAAGVTLEGAREAIVSGLAAASSYAHAKGVRLALENHGRLAGRGDQVRALILDVRDRAGNDALGANADTGNFLLVGEDSLTGVDHVADLTYMVHFKDFAPAPEGYEGFAYEAIDGSKWIGRRLGDGSANAGACVARLREAGFDGWLSLEYEGPESPFEAVPASLAAAQVLCRQPQAR